jgi:uncharacterized membrane protein YesL
VYLLIIGSNMPALRVLWSALVSLFDETIALVIGNVLWFLLNLPVFLVLVIGGLLFVPPDWVGWLIAGLGWLMLLLPTPAAVALGALAAEAAGPEVPRLARFWAALRTSWRLALACCGVSLAVSALITFNLVFYARMDGLVRLASILWLYAGLFWFGLHVYLVPLLHHVQAPRLLDVYRRAALIALGHAPQTLLLLLAVVVLGLLSLAVLPAYVLVAGALVSLVQAHALREVRRRHGDLAVAAEADSEGIL